MSATWYCCRQRAGPLVKECRYFLPRFDISDTVEDRRAKALIKKNARTAVNRTQQDRLELHLGLFGWKGMMHTLTFDDEHLPKDFKGVRRALQSFFKRSQRWRSGLGKTPPFPYIYAIEGLHHRYHVHFICNDDDLTSAEIQHLWRNGYIDDEPVLLESGGYRRLAEYLNKERTDGVIIPVGRHPWSCARSLTAMLPPCEKWKDMSGEIEIPESAIWSRRSVAQNDFGEYRYASWIEPDGSRACKRLMNRMNYKGVKKFGKNQGEERAADLPDLRQEDAGED